MADAERKTPQTSQQQNILQSQHTMELGHAISRCAFLAGPSTARNSACYRQSDLQEAPARTEEQKSPGGFLQKRTASVLTVEPR
jgi:hypothetical protein